MKKLGPKNRGSHPDGLPLARSGLYISCAYLTVHSLKSATRSSGFSDLFFHDDVARLIEESHTKARSHERGKGKGIISDSENLRAAASPYENSSEVSSENLRAFVASCETSPIRNRLLRLTADSDDLLAVIKQEGRV